MEFKVGDTVERIWKDNSIVGGEPAANGYTKSMPIGSKWVVIDVYDGWLVLRELYTSKIFASGGASSNGAFFKLCDIAFEEGQRVRCIDSSLTDNSLRVGEIYDVRDCTVNYVHLLGVGGGWMPKRFELVNDGVDPKVYARPESLARTNDPATSKGKRKTNKYERDVITVLSGNKHSPGYTGKEIAAATGSPLNCITPRFAPLRRKGLIKDSGQRRDKQTVWVLA